MADFCNATMAYVLLVMGALQIPDMIWYDMIWQQASSERLGIQPTPRATNRCSVDGWRPD